jgi:hypothetical protein
VFSFDNPSIFQASAELGDITGERLVGWGVLCLFYLLLLITYRWCHDLSDDALCACVGAVCACERLGGRRLLVIAPAGGSRTSARPRPV